MHHIFCTVHGNDGPDINGVMFLVMMINCCVLKMYNTNNIYIACFFFSTPPLIQHQKNNFIYRGYPFFSKDRKFLVNLKERNPSYDSSILERIKNRLPFFEK